MRSTTPATIVSLCLCFSAIIHPLVAQDPDPDPDPPLNVIVTGAGTNCLTDFVRVDNFYQQSGMLNAKPMYVHNSLQVAIGWNVNADSKWIIADENGVPLYENSTNTLLPPATGWVKVTSNPLCNDGADIVLTGDVAVLPVELTYFEGWIDPLGYAHLSWQTASEINNDGFEIQHSGDGEIWETLTFVPGYGTSNATHNYAHTDYKARQGTHYYRLKQIDFDGGFQYSDIVVLTLAVAPVDRLLGLQPNPAHESVSVKVAAGNDSPVLLRVFDLLGREVRSVTFQEHKGVLPLGGIPAGTYLVSVFQGGAILGTERLLIR